MGEELWREGEGEDPGPQRYRISEHGRGLLESKEGAMGSLVKLKMCHLHRHILDQCGVHVCASPCPSSTHTSTPVVFPAGGQETSQLSDLRLQFQTFGTRPIPLSYPTSLYSLLG